MAAIIDNRQLVDAPALARRRYGLFDAAQAMLDLDARGIASGVQFISDHCGGADVYNQTCTVSPVKPFMEGSDLLGSDPFWVIARKRCGTVGRSAEEMQAAVRQRLATGEQTAVEAVLWDGSGIVGHDPTLTGAGATVVTPAAPGAGAAIAALEEAFYSASGYLGTIHVNTAAYAAVAYSNLVERGQGGVRVTPLDSTWSFGAGYGITGPAGIAPAAGFVWAFMTSPVTIWRSGVLPQPDPRQTLDRTLNQWDVVAEEVFAATWDCPDVFAVQVPVAAPATATAPAVPV